jgi:hypothetical protein
VLNNPLRYTDPTGFFWQGLWNTLESPMFWAEFAMSAAVCVGAGPFGCFVFGIETALFNAGVAVGTGAGFEQTAISTGIGIGVGIATMYAPFLRGMNPLLRLAIGSASAAATTAIASRVSTGKWGADNILVSAFLSAAEGAAMMGIQNVATEISQASAEDGSGEFRNDAVARRLSLGSYAGQLSVGWAPDNSSAPLAEGTASNADLMSFDCGGSECPQQYATIGPQLRSDISDNMSTESGFAQSMSIKLNLLGTMTSAAAVALAPTKTSWLAWNLQYYSSDFHGNGSTLGMSVNLELRATAAFIGKVAFAGGALLTGYQTWAAWNQGNLTSETGRLYFEDVTVSAIGTFGGWPGAAFGTGWWLGRTF